MDEASIQAWGGSGQADQQTKMFVGGLAQTVNSDFLRTYFSHFGDIEDAFVLMDDHSGRSRGFGFVTFKHSHSLTHVLNQTPHFLGNKQVDCKPAVTKTQPTKRTSTAHFNLTMDCVGGPCQVPPATDFMNLHKHLAQIPSLGLKPEDEEIADWSDTEGNTDVILTGGGKSYLALSGDKWLEDCEEADARKIFVGGLPDISPAEFASFFEHFGPVADAMVMFDRKRRRQRGFGFITFATNDGVRNALQFNRHPVKGKLVEVKMAHPLVLQKARAPARRERDLAKANKIENQAKTVACSNVNGLMQGQNNCMMKNVYGRTDENVDGSTGHMIANIHESIPDIHPEYNPMEPGYLFQAGDPIVQHPPTFPDAPWHTR